MQHVTLTTSFLLGGHQLSKHLDHLEEVLKCLVRYGVQVKHSKCQLVQSSVCFLGHRIDAEDIHPCPDKLQAIMASPTPQNVRELHLFLGLRNYYGKFIPNTATILPPLNDLLRKDVVWNWSGKCQCSFNKAKESLASSDVLLHYNPALPIRLAADASAYGIGPVIAHVLADRSKRPVAFAFRTLTASERNYAQVDREALLCPSYSEQSNSTTVSSRLSERSSTFTISTRSDT